jgi:hypothetical protein
MFGTLKIAIHQIAVDPSQVNSVFLNRTNCQASTAVNFSVVHFRKKLSAVPARGDFNSRRWGAVNFSSGAVNFSGSSRRYF